MKHGDFVLGMEFSCGGLKITINGEVHHTFEGNEATYEYLVHVAGMSGLPSMTVRYSDGRGKIVLPGRDLVLEDGMNISVSRTGDG